MTGTLVHASATQRLSGRDSGVEMLRLALYDSDGLALFLQFLECQKPLQVVLLQRSHDRLGKHALLGPQIVVGFIASKARDGIECCSRPWTLEVPIFCKIRPSCVTC